MTQDIKTVAKMEYQARMKERLQLTPTIETLILEDKPITQADLDAINAAQKYANRERIPEPLLFYTDLYNELTGQEPTKTDVTDWIATAEDWKAKKLEPDNIRMAWTQAQDVNKGFTVGRMGALTVTAVGMKSKAKPAVAEINSKAVERTQELIAEKTEVVQKAVGIPETERERMRQWKARLATERITR